MGSRVESQEEEEPLNVNGRAILRNKVDQVADVVIEKFQIRDLIASKLRPQQSTRMRPAGSIEGEDPIAQQRVEFLVSVSKAEVLELRGQHGL